MGNQLGDAQDPAARKLQAAVSQPVAVAPSTDPSRGEKKKIPPPPSPHQLQSSEI